MSSQSMNFNTFSHRVAKPPDSVGSHCDYDFTGLEICGLDIPVGDQGTRLISGGQVVWEGTGFNFTISAAVYMIAGVTYSSPQTHVTLAPSDPSLDRIDVFYVSSSSTAGVITGTPGGPPLEPSIDPATQIRLTSAYIVAGSSTPVITNENIYLENVEWTTTTNSGSTINFNSPNFPFAGVKDIEGTSLALGNYAQFVKPSAGTVNLQNYTVLVLQIRLKVALANTKSFSLFWSTGITGAIIGTAVTLTGGTYGFNRTLTGVYQQVAIPVGDFNTDAASCTTLRIVQSGGGTGLVAGWYIDNVILQNGLTQPPVGGDFSTNTNVAVVNELVLFADTTGKLGKRSTGTGMVKLTNGVLSLVPSGGGTIPVTTNLLAGDGAGNAAASEWSHINLPGDQEWIYQHNFAGPTVLGVQNTSTDASAYATLTLQSDASLLQMGVNSLAGNGAAYLDLTGSPSPTEFDLFLHSTTPFNLFREGSSIVRLNDSLSSLWVQAGNTRLDGPISLNGSFGASGQLLKSQGSGSPAVWVSVRRNFTFGASRTSGVAVGKLAGFWTCPFTGTIVGWNITVDAGTVTLKIWKIATGTAKPTNANSINTSGISLSSGTSIRSSTLTDFTTTAVTAGDIFACEITAVSGVTELGGAVEITQS